MIAIVDYGIGNVKSILNAFEKYTDSIILTRDKKILSSSDGIILPGVGAFSHAMDNLIKYDLVDFLQSYANSNKPLLGICLGMQILLEESEEFGITKGLGLIKGKVVKIPVEQSNKIKLPHISWNEILENNISWENTILDNIQLGTDMYFVHSYAAQPENVNEILSITEYHGTKFCSSIKKGNIYGCQFHPEKSAESGLKIIENFINVCKKN